MFQTISDQDIQNMLRKIFTESQVKIGIDQPLVDILRAFNNGETIRALVQRHPRYREDKERIFPLYDEDEGFDDVAQDDDPIVSLVEDLAYYWEDIENVKGLTELATSYAAICNIASDLATYHCCYDSDRGVIAEH